VSLQLSITTIISGQRTSLHFYYQSYSSHLLVFPVRASTLTFHVQALGSCHPLYIIFRFSRELCCCYTVAPIYSLQLFLLSKEHPFFLSYGAIWPSSLTSLLPRLRAFTLVHLCRFPVRSFWKVVLSRATSSSHSVLSILSILSTLLLLMMSLSLLSFFPISLRLSAFDKGPFYPFPFTVFFDGKPWTSGHSVSHRLFRYSYQHSHSLSLFLRSCFPSYDFPCLFSDSFALKDALLPW